MYVYSASFVELTQVNVGCLLLLSCALLCKAHLANGHCNMDCCAISIVLIHVYLGSQP